MLNLVIAGDELHCLPGGSRIYGKLAANIHGGSTPSGKAITRCITPDPATLVNVARAINGLGTRLRCLLTTESLALQ